MAAQPDAPRVRRLADPEEIRGLLDAQRPYAATAFGYLDPRHFSRTEWYEGIAGNEPALLLMVAGRAGGMLNQLGGSGFRGHASDSRQALSSRS